MINTVMREGNGMKVILINGSPHKDGCTYTALKECKKGIEELGLRAEIVHIGNNPVYGCSACFECEESNRCIYDDICNEIIEKMADADGIIIGSPVYFAGPTGALCALLERIFFAAGEILRKKPAAAVVSCRRSGSTAAFDRLNKFFTYNDMPVVSSMNCWNNVHGNTPDEVAEDEEGLQTMRILGRNMAWMIKCMKSSQVEMPKDEEYVETNFIR